MSKTSKATPATALVDWLTERGVAPSIPVAAAAPAQASPQEQFAAARAALQPTGDMFELGRALRKMLPLATQQGAFDGPELLALIDDTRLPGWARLLVALVAGQQDKVVQLQEHTPALLVADLRCELVRLLPTRSAVLLALQPEWRLELSSQMYQRSDVAPPAFSPTELVAAVRAHVARGFPKLANRRVPIAASDDLSADVATLMTLHDVLPDQALLAMVCQVVRGSTAPTASKLAQLRACLKVLEPEHQTVRELRGLPVTSAQIVEQCDGTREGQLLGALLAMNTDNARKSDPEVALALVHEHSSWALPSLAMDPTVLVAVLVALDPNDREVVERLAESLGHEWDLSWWLLPQVAKLDPAKLSTKAARALVERLMFALYRHNDRGVDNQQLKVLRRLPSWVVPVITGMRNDSNAPGAWAALVELGYAASGTGVLVGEVWPLSVALADTLHQCRRMAPDEHQRLDRLALTWLQRLSAADFVGFQEHLERRGFGHLPAAFTDVLAAALAAAGGRHGQQQLSDAIARQMTYSRPWPLPYNRTLIGYAKDLAKAEATRG